VGVNIRKDVEWLALREGADFQSMVRGTGSGLFLRSPLAPPAAAAGCRLPAEGAGAMAAGARPLRAADAAATHTHTAAPPPGLARPRAPQVDLAGLYRVWNPAHKSWTAFGQEHLVKVLLGYDGGGASAPRGRCCCMRGSRERGARRGKGCRRQRPRRAPGRQRAAQRGPDTPPTRRSSPALSPAGEAHDAVTDAVKSMRLFHAYNHLKAAGTLEAAQQARPRQRRLLVWVARARRRAGKARAVPRRAVGADGVAAADRALPLLRPSRAAPQALLSAPIAPSFARRNPSYEGVCMGNRKLCTCGAAFLY